MTFPITDADGAMKVSFVLKGLFPMNIMTGLCLVKICALCRYDDSDVVFEIDSYIPLEFYVENLIIEYMQQKRTSP